MFIRGMCMSNGLFAIELREGMNNAVPKYKYVSEWAYMHDYRIGSHRNRKTR